MLLMERSVSLASLAWTVAGHGGIVEGVEARGGRRRRTAADGALRWMVVGAWVATVVLVVMALVLLAKNGPAPSFGRIVAAFYATHALVASPGSLPGGDVMGWLGTWVSAPALLLIPLFCFLLFPDGRLPAPRWRLVAWLDGLTLATATVGLAFRPGPLAVLPSVANPLAASGMAAQLASGLLTVGVLLLPVALVASVGSLIVRLRQAKG